MPHKQRSLRVTSHGVFQKNESIDFFVVQSVVSVEHVTTRCFSSGHRGRDASSAKERQHSRQQPCPVQPWARPPSHSRKATRRSTRIRRCRVRSRRGSTNYRNMQVKHSRMHPQWMTQFVVHENESATNFFSNVKNLVFMITTSHGSRSVHRLQI
jgi:hypothetical protein